MDLLDTIKKDLKEKYDGNGDGVITREEAEVTWAKHPDFKRDEL
jgi:hypothetical protein